MPSTAKPQSFIGIVECGLTCGGVASADEARKWVEVEVEAFGLPVKRGTYKQTKTTQHRFKSNKLPGCPETAATDEMKEGTLPPPPTSFFRMIVCGRGVLVGGLTMFVSRVSMLHCIVVLADIVIMRRLMVMMGGGVVVSGRLMVVITRRMLR
jgi:hypothetical protein